MNKGYLVITCHIRFYGQNQTLIVCMPRIKFSYIWPECKYRKPMSSFYHILLQVQNGLSSGKDTILPHAYDLGFCTSRRSLH
jgi:hypothetical protein